MKAMRSIITLSITVLLFVGVSTNMSFAGKPSGGGGGGKIKVTSASPANAQQGKALTVTIAGENFETGASVTFLVGDTDDNSQIIVNEVRVNSSTELEADVDVNSSALTVDYDIEVKAISGRKGKGTTLFKVQQAAYTCTGSEPKEPTIAFMTAQDTSEAVYTQDLYLSSASGCDQYLLLEDAMQFLPGSGGPGDPGEFLVNITELRLDVEGTAGVVTWRDRSQDPHPQVGLKFEIGVLGAVTPDPNGPQQFYVSSAGADARGADVRIDDQGDVELVMVERPADGSAWFISYLNADTGDYSIISGGSCPTQDDSGNCYQPSYSQAWWNDDGSQIYVGLYAQPVERLALARIQRFNDQWQVAEILMTHYTSLRVIGVTSVGLIAYEREEYETSKNGRRSINRHWVTAVIDPESCSQFECLPTDGIELAADGQKFPRGWTRTGGLLFIETGPGNQKNIREYSNPFTGEVGTLNLRDVDRDQRDTTF